MPFASPVSAVGRRLGLIRLTLVLCFVLNAVREELQQHDVTTPSGWRQRQRAARAAPRCGLSLPCHRDVGLHSSPLPLPRPSWVVYAQDFTTKPPIVRRKTKTNSTSISRPTHSETLSPSRSAGTGTEEETSTMTYTRSTTRSKVLPVSPGKITQITSSSIAANCLSDVNNAVHDRRCRTVEFVMINDGFDFDTADMRFRVRHDLISLLSAQTTQLLLSGTVDTSQIGGGGGGSDAGGGLSPGTTLAPIPLSQFVSPSSSNDVATIMWEAQRPYSVEQLWSTIVYGAAVSSNVTHLSIELGFAPGLEMGQGVDTEILLFNFSTPSFATATSPGQLLTLRNEVPNSGPTEFYVSIVAPRSDASTMLIGSSSAVLMGLGAISAMLGVVLTPFSQLSPLPDTQILVMMLSSPCTQPQSRQLMIRLYRMLLPALDDVKQLLLGLGQNAAMLFVALVLHGMVMYVVTQKVELNIHEEKEAAAQKLDEQNAQQRSGTAGGAASWKLSRLTSLSADARQQLMKAASIVYFPSLTVAVFLIVMPGIALTSASLIFGIGATGGLRILGMVVLSLIITACVAPPFLVDKVFFATSKKVSGNVHYFPLFFRLCLATSMWGPKWKVKSWTAPMAIMSETRLPWFTFPWCHVVLQALIRGIPVTSPTRCAGVYITHILVLLIHMGITLRFQPYRSFFFNFGSAFTSLMSTIPVVVSLTHSLNPASAILTDPIVINAIIGCFALQIFRGLIAVVLEFAERFFIRQVVWGDEDEEGQERLSFEDGLNVAPSVTAGAAAATGGRKLGVGHDALGEEELTEILTKTLLEGDDEDGLEGGVPRDVMIAVPAAAAGGPNAVDAPMLPRNLEELKRRSEQRRMKMQRAQLRKNGGERQVNDHYRGDGTRASGRRPGDDAPDDDVDSDGISEAMIAETLQPRSELRKKMGTTMTDEERDRWLYFGKIDPYPSAAQKYHAWKKAMIVKNREKKLAELGEVQGRGCDPMMALVQGRAAMPPELQQQQRREYEML